MIISFSTICPHEAMKRLNSKFFDWLKPKQKELVMKYLGKGIRVRDPNMYPRTALLEIENKEIYDEIIAAGKEIGVM